jgi:hypothetical protein
MFMNYQSCQACMHVTAIIVDYDFDRSTAAAATGTGTAVLPLALR